MKLKLFALAAAAVAGSASLAFADTIITQTQVVPSTLTDWTTDLAFNYFNPSLGALQSVTAKLQDDWNASGTVTNNAPTAQTFTFTESAAIGLGADGGVSASNDDSTIDGLLLGLYSTLSKSQNYDGLASGATAGYGPWSLSDTETYNAAAGEVSAFESNATGTGVFELEFSTQSGQGFTGGGGNTAASLTTLADATVTLTYDYTTGTPPVPEPASMALLGSGLIGLAGFVRRRRG